MAKVIAKSQAKNYQDTMFRCPCHFLDYPLSELLAMNNSFPGLKSDRLNRENEEKSGTCSGSFDDNS